MNAFCLRFPHVITLYGLLQRTKKAKPQDEEDDEEEKNEDR